METVPRFGDKVRIATTPETVAADLAGKIATVSGVTTPSITAIRFIGDAVNDVAVCLMFEGNVDNVWISPSLIELVDHNPGTTVTIDGIPVVMIRQPDGSWREVPRKLPVREWPAFVRIKLREWWNSDEG
jgi:hypothetical protein